jgi:hypothetical protein
MHDTARWYNLAAIIDRAWNEVRGRYFRAERTARPCKLPAKATGIFRRQPELEAQMGKVG